MAATFQTTFSNAFSWMKMYEFRLRFHWILFPWVQLTISQHWFRLWLDAGQATSHDLNQWWLVYWRIYASLGLNELNNYTHDMMWFEIMKLLIHFQISMVQSYHTYTLNWVCDYFSMLGLKLICVSNGAHGDCHREWKFYNSYILLIIPTD